MKDIVIRGAREGNLKNIDLTLPRGKFIALTGLSGSGKSTLAIDLLFNECQRQYLEAMGMQGIRRPDVDSVSGASPSLCIAQGAYTQNPRSSVGTVTGIYTELRMLFEKLHRRACPLCGAEIDADACREETLGHGEDFQDFMYCSVCGGRMDKLTRTDFSFNTRRGACPACQGLGKTLRIDEALVLHAERSLEEGAIDFWRQRYGDFEREAYYHALQCRGLPVPRNRPVETFTPAQRALLLYGSDSEPFRAFFPGEKPPKTAAEGKFPGAFTTLTRRLSEQGGDGGTAGAYFQQAPCPECDGERLAPLPRGVTVAGRRLAELSAMQLCDLADWLRRLEASLTPAQRALVAPYLPDLQTKIARIVRLGLGYLTSDRQTLTLSGGEAQRIRLAATLDSTMTGLIYVLDEPTVGLHPRDTDGLLQILRSLRDQENTLLVIEHDPDVVRAADWVIDIGPGSGRFGGRIVGQGTPDSLPGQKTSVTGRYLAAPAPIPSAERSAGTGEIRIRGAGLHNLKRVDVRIPTGCLTSVTGVSGSGKSSLVFGVLGRGEDERAQVEGLSAFSRVVTIDQAQAPRMRRSNVATFTGLYDALRRRFAALPEARALGLHAGSFSFNAKGGRCERCEGMGTVTSNLLFFEDAEVPCPECHGRRFQESVLSVRLDGRSIDDALNLSVEEAAAAFSDVPAMQKTLALLADVGLGYLTLGQALPTLSGGEAQRLKLARDLLSGAGKQSLYLIDEPTTGLHPLDVENFLRLLRRLADAGNTLVVVEHNLQVIAASDYVIDLGPDGGDAGGEVIACGTPEEICSCPRSFTGRYLKSYLAGCCAAK